MTCSANPIRPLFRLEQILKLFRQILKLFRSLGCYRHRLPTDDERQFRPHPRRLDKFMTPSLCGDNGRKTPGNQFGLSGGVTVPPGGFAIRACSRSAAA